MNATRRQGEIAPGFYKLRLAKGAPWVPVKVVYTVPPRDPDTGELLADERIRVVVGDQELPTVVDGRRLIGFEADRAERGDHNIADWLTPVTPQEYRRMLATGRDDATKAPALHPTRPARIDQVPIPFMEE